tara:strand:+ start:34002 stop:34121 length:120 start_codon:yes stop_codon:yes gene_type:complete
MTQIFQAGNSAGADAQISYRLSVSPQQEDWNFDTEFQVG